MTPFLFCTLIALTPAQQNVVWLDSLDLSTMEQDWGDPTPRNSVSGTPITLAKKMFSHGVGTHAFSTYTLDLHGAVESFSTDVGIDDEVGTVGSVRFEVWVDGKRKALSAALKGGMPPEHMQVALHGAKRMELVVRPTGNGIDYDHADWADAKFELTPGQTAAPTPIVLPTGATMLIYMAAAARPEINGPRAVGCTPGRPILFKIPASGEGPLQYSVRNLPVGISVDPKTGILSGTVAAPGRYQTVVTVAGPKGRDSRELDLVFGEHMLAQTPPMGWNSWNAWGTTVDAEKVKAAADAMIADSLIDYGYKYVNIDDAWEGPRDSNGEIQTNEKFRDMAALAAYVHSKGLGLGIYSSPGPQTCAKYPASYQHEQQDANTYAKWGIDYLKYDWCSYGSIAPHANLVQLKTPYVDMRQALDKAGRDVVYSLCQYGMGDVFNWGKSIGANLWRTTGDINDTYGSMSSIAFAHSEKAVGVSPGGWNDPDMLCVGKLGWGANPRQTRLRPNEQITHITMWSLLAAPLILGCDLTQLDAWTKALITNHDVLDVDQDPLGKAATRVYSTEDGVEVWSRPLWDGTVAVGLMNRGREPRDISASWVQLGIDGDQPVRDLWERRNIGIRTDRIHAEVPGHGAKLFRIGRITH
jgi:alpha-galactosidase